jgi:hypothetical protein
LTENYRQLEEHVERDKEEDIEEKAVEDPFLPPPLTAPATIQTSRAGRKRANNEGIRG